MALKSPRASSVRPDPIELFPNVQDPQQNPETNGSQYKEVI
jgi:hypothetical protein